VAPRPSAATKARIVPHSSGRMGSPDIVAIATHRNHKTNRSLKVAGVILALVVAVVGGPVGLLVVGLVGAAYYLYVNRIAEEGQEALAPTVLRGFRVALESRHRPNAEELLQQAWDLLRNPKFRTLAEGICFEARKLVASAGKSDWELAVAIQLQLLIDILLPRPDASETTSAWLCNCGSFNLFKEASCSVCGASSNTAAPPAAPTLGSTAPSLLSVQERPRGQLSHRVASDSAELPLQTCTVCKATSDAAAVFCGRCGTRLLQR
jgi:hypothetical protein